MANKTPWIYIGNTFESVTRTSFKKALILFEDTNAKLEAESVNDNDILLIYNDFNAFYVAYKDLYAQKQSVSGVYEGHTLNFENLIAQVPQKLRIWEGKVRSEYPEDSPEERMIFPNKRTPFTSGSYEERINALSSLVMTLNTFPNLAAVQALVQSFYNQLEGARLAQQKQEGQADKLSSLLESQRIATCTEMYGVLSRLMYKYRYQRERIEDYFDLSLIRTKASTGTSLVFFGKVTDTQNTPISNAKVSIPDVGYETYTDASGAFAMEIEGGTFNVEISANGYQTATLQNVLFEGNKDKELNIVLSV